MNMKNTDEARNYLIEETNQKQLISRKHKKVSRVLHYIERLGILISTICGCISISVFASLVGFPVGNTTSAVGLKICVINAEVKKYKSIIKKKKKKYDKVVLLAKLNGIEVLISKALTDSYISRNGFVLINNAPKEFDDIKQEIKNPDDK